MSRTDDYKRVELEAFKIGVECCFNTENQSKMFKFQELLSIMTTHLRKNDLTTTPSTWKNLKRNIGKCFGDKLKFFTWKERLYIYSAEIDVENLVKQLLEAREKCAYTVKTLKPFITKSRNWKMECHDPHNQMTFSQKTSKCQKCLASSWLPWLKEKIATIRWAVGELDWNTQSHKTLSTLCQMAKSRRLKAFFFQAL